MVTTFDLVQLLGMHDEPADRPVEAFMSTPLVTVDPSTTVGEAVARMSELDIDRLVVTDNGEAVELVSTEDVLRYVPQVLHRERCGSPPGAEYRFRPRQETAYEKLD